MDTVLGGVDDRRGKRIQNVDPEDGNDGTNEAEFFIEKMMQPSQQKNLPANQKMVVKVSSSLFLSLKLKPSPKLLFFSIFI